MTPFDAARAAAFVSGLFRNAGSRRVFSLAAFSVAMLVIPLATRAADSSAKPLANARKHWAFQPLQRPPIPAPPTSPAPSAHPIDAFLARALAADGLSLSPRAPKDALLRRLAFTLTGLPPTPEEIEAFARDDSPHAIARAADRYLASARFGERWGKHWLDAAGYADSNGYFSADSDRPLAYRYRDWVIRAVNRDLPFDQFVRAQLAGDELAAWTPGTAATPEIIDLLEATHFLRNGQDGTAESDGNPEEVRTDRYYALEATMQIIGSSLLGLTLQCAKCHDHKFEPVTQRDYYRLQAVLYPAFNIEKWITPKDRIIQAALPGEMERWQALENSLDHETKRLRADLAAWLRDHRPAGELLFSDDFSGTNALAARWSATAPGDNLPGGTPPVKLDSPAAPAALQTNGTLRIIESGQNGDRWLATTQSFHWRPARTGEWIEATFDLVALKLDDKGKPAERVAFFIAARDFNHDGPVRGGNILLDGNPAGGAVVVVDYPGKDSKSRGQLGKEPYQAGRNYGVRVTRRGDDDFALEHLVDHVPDGAPLKLAAADLPDGGFAFEYCCGRSFIVDNVRIERSPAASSEKLAAAEKIFREQSAAKRKAFDDATKQLATRRQPKPGRIAWVSDLAKEPPVVRLLDRGNHQTPGEKIEPATFAFLSNAGTNTLLAPASTTTRGTGRRLAWARWLTEPNSPQSALLARVTVNRVWQHYFGRGLVETPDNFGLSGAAPSQPELLEWLAAELVANGWQLKPIHRLLATSAAFQQSSAPRADALARDADNLKLWRFPLRRLDAEAIRDGMLAAAGQLGPKSSGPYVPTKRDGVGETIVDETNPDARARSVFLQQRRSQVPTFLTVFDAPSIVFNCTRRPATTMPLQSLSLLNSEFAVRRAADLAQRVEQIAGKETEARLRTAFQLTAARSPRPDELTAALAFLESQTALHRANKSKQPEQQAWADLCQSLLASHNFLYLE